MSHSKNPEQYEDVDVEVLREDDVTPYGYVVTGDAYPTEAGLLAVPVQYESDGSYGTRFFDADAQIQVRVQEAG